MGLKTTIKNRIGKLLKQTTYRKNNRIIRGKINNLKKKGMYEPIPLKNAELSITKSGFGHKSDSLYHDFFYSISGVVSPDIIPLTTYYTHIEPVLNHIGLLIAIKDKNFYDYFMEDIPSPETYLRKINGGYYDGKFNPVNINAWNPDINSDAIILKPSIESGAGKSILKFSKEPDGFQNKDGLLTACFLKGYPDFVLQESVVQHPFYSQFNPNSNNTIRILTYRSVMDEKIHILHRLLRIGKKGSFLDHDNFGGIAAGIKPDGRLNPFGCDVMGIKHESFNDISLNHSAIVPSIKQVEELSLQIASKIYYGRLLALDFTVDQSGQALLLEVNCWRNGISQYQMNLGPLFGRFTSEILKYCKDKSYQHLIKI